MIETIQHAAIQIRDTKQVFTGKSHYQCMLKMKAELGLFKFDNGFMTSENRFVDRKEAEDIAVKANQIKKLFTNSCLLSEDFWYYGGYSYDEVNGYHK